MTEQNPNEMVNDYILKVAEEVSNMAHKVDNIYIDGITYSGYKGIAVEALRNIAQRINDIVDARKENGLK